MKHVQIVSVGHSGSSLLNLILGAHPAMRSVGEIWTLQEMWDTDTCACGAPLAECAFWEQVSEEVGAGEGIPAEQLARERPLRAGVLRRRRGKMTLWPSDLLVAFGGPPTIHAAARLSPTLRRSVDAIRHNLRYLEAASRIGGSSLVVDSSKNPLRARLLYLEDPDSFRMIHMVRDGRAVANSWRRAYGLHTYRQASLQWYLREQLIRLYVRTVPESRRYLLRYEDLCVRPEATLETLCGFLEVEFDPDMLEFQEGERHDVHINPRPLRSANREVRLDEKWRSVVTPKELTTFERIAGRWNRRYGYAD